MVAGHRLEFHCSRWAWDGDTPRQLRPMAGHQGDMVALLYTTNELLPSLKLTYPMKMDGWNTSFLLGWPIFRGELLVLGRVFFQRGQSMAIITFGKCCYPYGIWILGSHETLQVVYLFCIPGHYGWGASIDIIYWFPLLGPLWQNLRDSSMAFMGHLVWHKVVVWPIIYSIHLQNMILITQSNLEYSLFQ